MFHANSEGGEECRLFEVQKGYGSKTGGGLTLPGMRVARNAAGSASERQKSLQSFGRLPKDKSV